MKKLKNSTLNEYTDLLASHKPAPGGGSAAALTGALGVSLIAMVAHYSKGKNQSKASEKKIANILKECKNLKKSLMDCVDSDAQAYKKVLRTRSGSKERTQAQKEARKVPQDVCRYCYKAISLTPYLVQKGNSNLISDIEVAVEMLFASYNSSLILSKL
jgi:formiminotetrahydrofolate cyclodeaminase